MKTAFHVMDALHSSGMERMFVSSAGIWQSAGWQIVIATQGNENPYLESIENADYEVIVLPRLRSLRGLRKLRKVLRELHPDLVHIHSESMHGPISIVVRLTLPRVKIVRTVHSVFRFQSFTALKRHFQHFLSRVASVIYVAPSQDVASNEKNMWFTNCVVVENWVSTEFTSNLQFSPRVVSRMLKVAIVGNCSPIKNHEAVLGLLMDLKDLRVIHIGDESHATNAEVELFSRLRDSDQLLRLGSRDDVRDLLTECDLFAMPSIHEGFSVALAEAMSMGIPSIIGDVLGVQWAANLPGVRQVKQGETWLQVLSSLLAGEIVALSISAQKNSKIFQERFSPTRGVGEYVSIYEA